MKSKMAVVSKSFQGLERAMEEANVRVSKMPEVAKPESTGTLIVGKLGKPNLMGADQAREVRAAVKELEDGIRTNVRMLGEVLADEDSYQSQFEKVRQTEETIVAAVLGTTTKLRAQSEAATTYVEAMIHDFPREKRASLLHISCRGSEAGFLRMLADGEKKFFVEIPFTDQSGKRLVGKFTSDVSGTRAVATLRSLMEFAATEQKAFTAAQERRRLQAGDRAKVLKEGADTLSNVLKAGTGEAYCFIPSRPNGHGGNFSAAHMRLRVERGTITVVDVTGNPFVELLVGISIPTRELDYRQFSQKMAANVDESTLRLMAGLRNFLQDALGLNRPKPTPAVPAASTQTIAPAAVAPEIPEVTPLKNSASASEK